MSLYLSPPVLQRSCSSPPAQPFVSTPVGRQALTPLFLPLAFPVTPASLHPKAFPDHVLSWILCASGSPWGLLVPADCGLHVRRPGVQRRFLENGG